MSSEQPFRLAITATFTADPLERPLRFWSGPMNTPFEVRFSPFGQVLQSLLDPTSDLRTNQHGLNVVLLRSQDWGAADRRRENLAALAGALQALPLGKAPYLVLACAEREVFAWSEFATAATRNAGVYFLDAQWVAQRYPVKDPFSSTGEKAGAVPYTEDYYLALAASIVRVAHAHQHPPAKVLALDCDNTLWEGICGEDGPEGVRLTAGHAALQRFALAQRAEGTLLVIASKNNQADVEATFAAHPEFPLRLEHITAHRINWKPKPENLASLAKELSLGLDSFVFLDDSRKEIMEVARELPPVVAIQVPNQDEDLEELTRHLWVLDRLRITDADRARAASYEQTQEFGRALAQAQSLEDFYQSLDLQVNIRGVEEADFPRASQLTQRTNQFNFTTVRRTEAELRQLWQARHELYRVDVSDRFGDYGFTGLLLGRPVGATYVLDTFLLSCRVLGRGVEHAIIRWLANHAEKLGLREMEIPFVPTAKNQPAQAFLEELGATTYPLRRTPAELKRLELKLAVEEPAVLAQAAAQAPGAARSLDYALLANHLSSVEKLRRAIYPEAQIAAQAFATDTERRLAALWADLLPGASLEAESNFFEAGGHSLLAVLLLTRIQEAFGVELGIDEAYSIDMTLERMARRIDEALSFGGLSQSQYQALYDEINALSEEEVLAALENEESR
ncbi:MAG: HAD-IIIC family phosphatase [Bryobacter sp.]|nr:HAD-IIIC family phosphatase [Bryobacter sp.]